MIIEVNNVASYHSQTILNHNQNGLPLYELNSVRFSYNSANASFRHVYAIYICIDQSRVSLPRSRAKILYNYYVLLVYIVQVFKGC